MAAEDIRRSATDATVSDTLEGMENRSGALYPRLWRAVPGELGFLLPAMPVATLGFSLAFALLSAAIGTIVTFVLGVLFLVGLLYFSRWFGELELLRLHWAGRPSIPRPEWRTAPGLWGWLRSLVADGHYWLYTLHTLVVNAVVSLVTWTVTITWLAVGLGGTTYWLWVLFLPEGGEGWFLSRLLAGLFGADGGASSAWHALDWRAFDSFAELLIGVLFLAALPFVTRGLVLLHDAIARGLLGRFASDDLRIQVTELSSSRGAAISAEGHSLRRLERDIHDGPQQRLVRLQMDLAAAERQLATDPDAARALLSEARAQSQEALDELRALSRGFAPPILLDRGLVAALESLASRSTLPVTVTSGLEPGLELPQEIERNAYFVASELVTNAAKHSGASEVQLSVGLRRVPERDDWWLDVTVADDGRGGAASVAGHGLAGLEERLRGLGGTLELESPVGGPTVATGHLPVTY